MPPSPAQAPGYSADAAPPAPKAPPPAPPRSPAPAFAVAPPGSRSPAPSAAARRQRAPAIAPAHAAACAPVPRGRPPREQPSACNQALPQFLLAHWRWGPRFRMALKTKLGQQSSVETIRRAAARERLRRVVDVRGIDHSDMVASAVQGNCKGDPGAAGGFEDDEGGLGRNTGGSKLLLEGSKASGSLLEGARRSWRLAVPGPSGQEGGGSNVDTGDELRV